MRIILKTLTFSINFRPVSFNIFRLQAQLNEKDDQLQLTDENTSESELLTLRNENDRLKNKVAEIERTLHFDHETIEQKTQELIQLKLEFDNRVDTANKEIDILKTLVADQKKQLIDTLTENETETNVKTAKIEELELKLVEMSKEVEDTKTQFASSRDEYVEQLQGKCDCYEFQHLLKFVIFLQVKWLR